MEIGAERSPDTRTDAARWAEIYPKLRRFAAVAADWDIDPDDLVQEVLARALARGPLSELETPLAYLRRAILNLVANERRSASRQRHAFEQLSTEVDRPAAYPSDLAILFELSALDRTVLFMADVESAPTREIAQSVGLSELAVRHRVSRARKVLRRRVEDQR